MRQHFRFQCKNKNKYLLSLLQFSTAMHKKIVLHKSIEKQHLNSDARRGVAMTSTMKQIQ